MTNILQGNVVDFDDDFNGIVVLDDGCKVAIPGAIVGETVQFHIEHRSMHEPKAWGRCDGLVKTSNARILKTKCRTCWPTAGMCAGCPIMHIDDSTQAQMKRTAVERALAKAGITYIDEVPFVRADSVFHYRNRTDLVASEIRGRLVLGSYKPRSHDVIETKVCPILRPPLNQALAFIVSTARKMHIFASKPGVFFATGALRYVSLFANAEGKVLVDLVVNSAYGKVPNWIRPFANKLKEFSPIVGVSYSINDSGVVPRSKKDTAMSFLVFQRRGLHSSIPKWRLGYIAKRRLGTTENPMSCGISIAEQAPLGAHLPRVGRFTAQNLAPRPYDPPLKCRNPTTSRRISKS